MTSSEQAQRVAELVESALDRDPNDWSVKRVFGRANLIRHFRQEERILAGLKHPYTARLYGAAVTDDGVPYFVMEYVEGERLDTYCKANGLTIPERLQLFRKICSAVSYAQQQLIIHRDLKPANIRVTAQGEPKLLDFGIARLLGDETPPAEQTMTLAAMMTPDYAGPEQVRGERMTTQSDVYSLGVVLYELLTGTKPYSTAGQRPDEMSRAITERTAARPSATVAQAQDAAREARSLRGDLDNIVLMAMRKEPGLATPRSRNCRKTFAATSKGDRFMPEKTPGATAHLSLCTGTRRAWSRVRSPSSPSSLGL